MLRYLSERLPAMITPHWVHNRIQPIAVLYYLVQAARLPPNVNRAFDIGGPDVFTYLTMMRKYAVVAGLTHRLVIPVPVLTPWLSAQWVNLVTPVPRDLAIPLIESLVNEVVCHAWSLRGWIDRLSGGVGLRSLFHDIVFGGMVRNITGTAEHEHDTRTSGADR